MKIIIVGTAHPYRGGLAAYNERLAKEFSTQGHDVNILTFTLQYPGFLFPGKTQFTNGPAPENLHIERCINSVNPLNWLRIGKKIRKESPDMVIFCYWMSFMAPCFGTIARAASSPKTKFIALVHNMMPHEPSILDKIFPKYFVDKMDGFMTMASSVADDVRNLKVSDKPVSVSPHPIYDHYGDKESKEIAAERLGLPADVPYILFFGFIRKYKGLDLLLEALADERLRRLPAKLIVAGEFYEDEDSYLKIISDKGLEDRVILKTEFIPDSKVKDYFNIADLIAQPYRSATQSGVSQIAYHFDKPMLVTDVGGLSEIVPDGKVGYVTEVNPKKIADAIVDFYTNDKKETFIENIRQEKLKYSWKVMTDKILDLYGKI